MINNKTVLCKKLGLKEHVNMKLKCFSTTIHEIQFEYDLDDEDYNFESLSKEYEQFNLDVKGVYNPYFHTISLKGKYKNLLKCYTSDFCEGKKEDFEFILLKE